MGSNEREAFWDEMAMLRRERLFATAAAREELLYTVRGLTAALDQANKDVRGREDVILRELSQMPGEKIQCGGTAKRYFIPGDRGRIVAYGRVDDEPQPEEIPMGEYTVRAVDTERREILVGEYGERQWPFIMVSSLYFEEAIAAE